MGPVARILPAGGKPRSGAPDAEIHDDRVMVARGVAGRAVDNFAGQDLDGVVGQDVVDADARAFVRVDEVGGNGIAPSRRRYGVPQSKLAEAGEHQLAAVDELVDGPFSAAREAAKRLDQPPAIDPVLRADAVEVAAYDQRPGEPGDQLGEVMSLVLGLAMRMGMIGGDGELALRGVDDGSETAPIVDAQLLGSGDRVAAQDGIAPGAVVERGGLVGKAEEIGIVDPLPACSRQNRASLRTRISGSRADTTCLAASARCRSRCRRSSSMPRNGRSPSRMLNETRRRVFDIWLRDRRLSRH